MSYSILTDTSANLPTAKASANGVIVVPLSYTMDGRECVCLDTDSFHCAEYYQALKNGTTVTTSQINPQKYIESMEPVLKKGEDILFIGMSSGISGSFASAEIARNRLLEDFPDREIRLVDSLGASLGEGLLVEKAVSYRNQGMELNTVAEKLSENRKNIYQLFTVDDLMYLHKGGRLSNAVALVGTVLNVKPLLKGNAQGKIVVCGKARGRKRVIEQIAKRYGELVVGASEQIVGISHCNCPEDAHDLADLITQKYAPKEIQIVEHEPVTGSYLGAGALALYFEGNDNIRNQ